MIFEGLTNLNFKQAIGTDKYFQKNCFIDSCKKFPLNNYS